MRRKSIRSEANKPPHARNVQPHNHDSYASNAKDAGVQVCDVCGVVQHGGRWYWGEPPAGEVRSASCPACQRIRDRHPVGTIHVPAAMIANRDEVVSLIRRVEEAEREEHALERIMSIEDERDALLVTTTGVHLARRLASRLGKLLHAKPRIHYGDENAVRVDWPEEVRGTTNA